MLKYQGVAQPKKIDWRVKSDENCGKGLFSRVAVRFCWIARRSPGLGPRGPFKGWTNSDDSRFSEAVSEYWGGNDRNKLSQNCLFVKHFNFLKIWGWPLGCLNWLIWKRYVTWVNFSHIMATVTLKRITPFDRLIRAGNDTSPECLVAKMYTKTRVWKQSVLIPWIFTRQWREHRSVVVAFGSPTVTKKTLSTIYSKHRAGQKGSRIWWLQLDDLPILLCNLMNSIRISFNVDLIHHQTKLVSPWKYTNVYCSISYYCEQNHNVSCYDWNTPEAWSEQRASTWLARWDHMHPGSFFEPKRWHSKTLLFRVTLFIFVLSFSGWSLVTIKISKHTLMMQFDAIRQYWRRCLELAVMNIPSKWGVKEPRVCQFWFCIMFL